MANIALIVLFSFALFLSAKPIVGHQVTPTLPTETELGPAPAGDAAEETAEGEISSDQLKKIGSEVKEAFQNIEDNVNAPTSPDQEEQIMEEFAKELAPSPGDDDGLGPSSDDGVDADAPSSDGGAAAGGPSSDGGDAAGGPSSDGGDAADAPSSGDAAGAPSSDGGDAAGAPSSGGSAGAPSSGGAAGAPSPGDDDENPAKDGR